MDEYSRKYLIDVLTACDEVASFFPDKCIFADFQYDTLRQRAVERNVEIMGEAINQLHKYNPSIVLSDARPSSPPGIVLSMGMTVSLQNSCGA